MENINNLSVRPSINSFPISADLANTGFKFTSKNVDLANIRFNIGSSMQNSIPKLSAIGARHPIVKRAQADFKSLELYKNAANNKLPNEFPRKSANKNISGKILMGSSPKYVIIKENKIETKYTVQYHSSFNNKYDEALSMLIDAGNTELLPCLITYQETMQIGKIIKILVYLSNDFYIATLMEIVSVTTFNDDEMSD